jgi:hypothetical protein
MENRQLLSGNPLGALASPNIDSPAYTTAACYPTTGPLLHLATSTTQASTKTALASPKFFSPAYTTAACYPTTGPLLHLAIQPCHLMLGYFDPQDFHDPGIDLDGVKENEGVGPLPSLSSLSSLSSLPASHDRPGFSLAPG